MFLISCLFKKTCSHKKCPFRLKDLTGYDCGCGIFEIGCRKCPYPYDEQERKEYNETLKRIQELIDRL